MTTKNPPKKSATETPVQQELLLTRVFNAPRALVWQAWTDPKHLAQWWGPHNFTNPRCEVDVRAGGVIRIDMRGANGVTYPMSGVYLEVIAPERIVFTSGAMDQTGKLMFEFLNTVTFAEKNGKTTLTLESRLMKATAEAKPYLSGHKAGWGQSLERLASLLAGNAEPLVLERTFNAPVEKVWTAITTKEAFDKWYFEMPDFKAKVGFEFRFVVEHEGNQYDHRCRVTEVVPGKKIAYTWRYEGHEGNTLVTFELFPEGAQTRLVLTHTGLETLPKTAAFPRENFQKGWNQLIGTNLREYLE
jgi:uncharacterized protein YndB with AHSA1/START domain